MTAKKTSEASYAVVEKCIKELSGILGNHLTLNDWSDIGTAIAELKKVAKRRGKNV